ncbi:MAG: hypothetical protein ABI353_24480, partial [Isosphaeraceae bacterium]
PVTSIWLALHGLSTTRGTLSTSPTRLTNEPKPGAPSEPKLGAPNEPKPGAPSEPKLGAPSEPKPGAPNEPNCHFGSLVGRVKPAVFNRRTACFTRPIKDGSRTTWPGTPSA